MKKYFLLLQLLCISAIAMAQNSILMAESMMKIHADSIQVKTGKPANWDYEQGLFLKALEQVYIRTGDAKYFDF